MEGQFSGLGTIAQAQAQAPHPINGNYNNAQARSAPMTEAILKELCQICENIFANNGRLQTAVDRTLGQSPQPINETQPAKATGLMGEIAMKIDTIKVGLQQQRDNLSRLETIL